MSSAGLLPHNATTPDTVGTRLGSLQFRDGFPTADTAAKVYDELTYIRAVDTFMNGYQGVSQYAIRKSFIDSGVNDNNVLIFSGLMDSRSLFLTANTDTVYFWTYLDLSKGPIVVEAPADVIGVIDDMWWRWVTDIGTPGPDRGEGGRYLLVGPGYSGSLPQAGYFVGKSRTLRVSLLGRAFLENNDPAPAAARIKSRLKIYPYQPGSYGSSIGAFLNGESPLGALGQPGSPKFVEGTGKVMNTIPPNDYMFYEMLSALVQDEPAEALDPEIGGQLAAIGIAKGKQFVPDAHQRQILEQAIAFANAASRTVSFSPSASEGFTYYDTDSAWVNSLFVGGYEFLAPPPLVTKDGVKPFPATGARTLNARIAMFYVATGITPAMVMRLPKIGSQYLGAFLDRQKRPFDGGRTYKLTLPKDIPAEKFWSLTVYDNQSRSMLATEQRFPRAGSQSFPTPAAQASPDGATTVYFGPRQPPDVAAGNWIQTVAERGWFVMLRLYSPLQSFFDKTWRPGEVTLVQ
jgi:hypothetical protein